VITASQQLDPRDSVLFSCDQQKGNDLSIQVIPTVRCDMILTGSSGCRDEVTAAMQMKSTSVDGDWRVSTGDVRCTCSEQVTAIMLRFFPDWLTDRLAEVKSRYDLRSVMMLHIGCEASSFPFINLDESLIRFLLSTDTELILSVSEGDGALDDYAVRLRLNMSGHDLAFDKIEEYTGKTPWFKRRRADFPISAQNITEDTWIYRTEAFPVCELNERASTFYNGLSDKRLAEDVPFEKCSLELNIYGADGISFESAIPAGLLRLASELSAQIWVGRYAEDQPE